MTRLTEERSAEFIAGARWAIAQFEIEAHDLSDIRDGYIEAKMTGTHGGRRIPPDMAKTFAGNFHERSDALFLAAEHVTAALASLPQSSAPDRGAG